ncbi:hypothetical protein OIE62_20645 [Streptomyces scopuliridis]|uniref:Uncharacterized protein n=1 Tax=Streptomyces scopuliridis TaxID=452529 RepID=A0ACD4ZLE8_9ACTN|nr:hypothetical protein [Streptomyces scopuliridis]WSB99130.1 hypothetical protein OG835_20305 [Streptomyces scopuliridis]WSC07168.1 hypothetical protein OIE62_20645 [Streptomyces scopuliridis]
MQQRRSRRLMAAHGPSLSYTEAWCLVALARDPAELPFVHSLTTRMRMQLQGPSPGVSLDVWAHLETVEQHRRIAWLNRYGATPLSLLGLSEELIELAGLHIIEWALPPGIVSNSIVVQRRPGPSDNTE